MPARGARPPARTSARMAICIDRGIKEPPHTGPVRADGAPPLTAPPRRVQGPPVPMVRRHARSKREFHYAAAVHVVSGNYLAAQRRGVVHGVDHGYAGYVRFVDAEAIGRQLDGGNIVLLSNLGCAHVGHTRGVSFQVCSGACCAHCRGARTQ